MAIYIAGKGTAVPCTQYDRRTWTTRRAPRMPGRLSTTVALIRACWQSVQRCIRGAGMLVPVRRSYRVRGTAVLSTVNDDSPDSRSRRTRHLAHVHRLDEWTRAGADERVRRRAGGAGMGRHAHPGARRSRRRAGHLGRAAVRDALDT